MSDVRILRATWAAPISSAPLENAEIVIEDDRIAEVRPASGLSGPEVEEFGNAVLMPGLVNVHTHLDYTVMRGLLEDLEFFPWIRELTARAGALTLEDWLASARWGAAEAVAGGVTTIGDCTYSGSALTAAREFGLGGRIYQEVFGIDELQPVDRIVAELKAKVGELSREARGTHLIAGISPHAPYTVRPALFRALAEYAAQDGLHVCIHAAESQAEASLLRTGTGPFAEMFARREIAWEIPGTSSVRYLDGFGILGPNVLLVHGVQLDAGDRAIIRERKVAWAHCPKSNAKLGAGVAPLGLMGLGSDTTWQAGDLSRDSSVRVGLGSDSVASNNAMDLFEEMRFAVLVQRAAHRKSIALGAEEVVRLATIGGARALGLDKEIGTLEPGKRADMCVVGLDGLHTMPAYSPYNALVYAARASDVLCTVIGGRVRYDARSAGAIESRFPENSLPTLRADLMTAARRMSDWRRATS